MKRIALPLIFVFGVLRGALAQSPSPAGGATYFGSTSPNGAAVDPQASPAPTPAVDGQPEKKVKGTPDAGAPSDDSQMKKGLELLKLAKEKFSASSSPTKADVTLIVESARDAIKKSPGDGRYHGHRVKAITKVNSAIEELKAGDPSKKAFGLICDGITEVYAGGGLYK